PPNWPASSRPSEVQSDNTGTFFVLNSLDAWDVRMRRFTSEFSGVKVKQPPRGFQNLKTATACPTTQGLNPSMRQGNAVVDCTQIRLLDDHGLQRGLSEGCLRG